MLEAKEDREIQRERETNENEALVRFGGARHAAEELSHDVRRLYIFQCYRARHVSSLSSPSRSGSGIIPFTGLGPTTYTSACNCVLNV